jgi:hypothetical protein
MSSVMIAIGLKFLPKLGDREESVGDVRPLYRLLKFLWACLSSFTCNAGYLGSRVDLCR